MAKVTINKDVCIGCGLCSTTCPNVFEKTGDKAKVKAKDVKEADLECAQKAASSCPVHAISVQE
jgi:ferredoxin